MSVEPPSSVEMSDGSLALGLAFQERRPWNEDRLVAAKRALKQQQVWAIRFWLDQNRRRRDRALSDFAIDPLRTSAFAKVRFDQIDDLRHGERFAAVQRESRFGTKVFIEVIIAQLRAGDATNVGNKVRPVVTRHAQTENHISGSANARSCRSGNTADALYHNALKVGARWLRLGHVKCIAVSNIAFPPLAGIQLYRPTPTVLGSRVTPPCGMVWCLADARHRNFPMI